MAPRQTRRLGLRDPSENVLALNDAQAKFQEKFDELTARFNAAETARVVQYFDALMAAERRRVDGLAALKNEYDNRITMTLASQVKATYGSANIIAIVAVMISIGFLIMDFLKPH